MVELSKYFKWPLELFVLGPYNLLEFYNRAILSLFHIEPIDLIFAILTYNIRMRAKFSEKKKKKKNVIILSTL